MNKITALIVVQLILLASVASALTISDVSSSPNEIQPGEKVFVSLTIQNPSDDDVENVVIGLDLTNVPFAPYQSSSVVMIEKIKSDNEKDVEFELIANSDADSGIYKIPVSVVYKNSTKPEPIGIISLIINAKPVISLSIDSPGLIRGQANDLPIKVTNNGLGDAKAFSIKVLAFSGARITGSDYFFLGDISKEDFDTTKVSLFVNENAGTLNIPAEISYKDSRNNEFSSTEYLSVKTLSRNDAIAIGLLKKSNTGIYIGVVIVLVVIYLIYRYIRKRRRNKIKQVQ